MISRSKSSIDVMSVFKNRVYTEMHTFLIRCRFKRNINLRSIKEVFNLDVITYIRMSIFKHQSYT